MADYLDPKTLTSEELYKLQSDTWGQGYDAGQGILLKAVETAEFFATNRERKRIIELIERRICFDAQDDPDGRCPHHGGKCYDLRELINGLIKGENK